MLSRIKLGRSSIRIWLAASLLMVLLTIVFTWPLPLKLSHSVVGDYGDNMHFAWMIGWFDRALFDLHISPYHVPQLNYPQGWDLARSEIPLMLVLPGLPFAAAGNPVLGYNIAVLLSFVLTGLAAVWWLRDLGRSWAASVFAGVAFAFNPFRMAHFRAGHLNILATMWFPVLMLGVFRVLRGRRLPLWQGIASGVALGFVSLSSQYYFYLTVLVGGALAVGYLLIFDRAKIVDGEFWRKAGVIVLSAAPFALAGIAPYLSVLKAGGLQQRSVYAVASGSASLTDFLLPSTDHFLWGSWISQHFIRDHWIEGSLYLGVVAMCLAIVGLLSLWRTERRLFWLFVGLALISLVIAIGPYLHWNEQLVSIHLPAALADRLGQETLAVPLPGYFLFKVVPLYDRMRTFKRAGILVLLAISVLAGVGLDVLAERVPHHRRGWLITLLFVLLAIDFYPGPFDPWSKVEPRPVDLWLAGQPGGGAVAQFPFDLEEDQLHVYYTLYNQKPFLGGFFNAYPPEQYRRIAPVMATFPSDESLDLLAKLGVQYVLVEGDAYFDSVKPELERSPAADDLIGRIGDQWLLELKSKPVSTGLN